MTTPDSPLSGCQLIGVTEVHGDPSTLHATNPATGQRLAVDFSTATPAQVKAACELAAQAAAPYAASSPAERAAFLDAIAEELLAASPSLTARAQAETGLPMPRVEGELQRTAGQMTLFASVLRKGRYLRITVDTAQEDRKPLPKPSLRTMQVPLGPIAVFGASNFPLAYSAAGGDTASALAAGCPVVARAHPAHPGTAELAARAILRAAGRTGMPQGVYSLLTGAGNALGQQIVEHPAICGVGFTGSRKGGVALAALAANRPVPIPVFAEMSSVNPVFLFPGALRERGSAIAAGLVASVLQGVGQFCTSPGLVFGIGGADWQAFTAAAAKAMESAPSETMLHAGIAGAYAENAESLATRPGVRVLARGAGANGCGAQPMLCSTTADAFLRDHHMSSEVFGPASLVVECESLAQMQEIAARLEGQLTATVQLSEQDHATAGDLVSLLTQKAGRLVANGFPTGLEVGYATIHGGPCPATTDSRWTAVGARAIERWLRPVCYQNFPEALLPRELKSDNPLGLPVVQDGDPRG